MKKHKVRCAVYPNGFDFGWVVPAIGFGSIFISVSKKSKRDKYSGFRFGRMLIDSECMGPDFVKKIICQAIDEAEWKQ